jgi:nitroimidazol reductase NimA-like FMN-containing flavoprotein (pyridoxamine 5'-phosphate oxidase superfamily)
MRVLSISLNECGELLKRVSIGRLACSLNDQPYVVPVRFA